MRRTLMVILMSSLILSCGLSFADLTNEHTQKADALKAIGLFSGSSKGYELNRAPNRVEAAVMLVRLLGKETDVKANVYTHPFTDVPAWANNYVGFMYTNQLSKGISETTFGADKLVDANSYATFVLRALGYNDGQGEFSWATALDFAAEKGILTQTEKKTVNTHAFLRTELVSLSYGTLQTPLKGTSKNLIDQLIEEKVVDPHIAVDYGMACEEKYKAELSEVVYLYGTFKEVDYKNEPTLNMGTSLSPSSVTLMINKTANTRMMRVNLLASTDAVQQKDVFAKLSFYNKSSKVFTVYALPWFLKSHAVFSADIIVEPFDEVRYVVYEPSLQSAYGFFGKVPYLKVNKDQYKLALSMMEKATYIDYQFVNPRCELTKDATNLFRALTKNVVFYKDKLPFYLTGLDVTEDVSLSNLSQIKEPMVGNPPVINIVSESSSNLNSGMNWRYDENFKATGSYDLVINNDLLAYYVLYDIKFKPTAVLLFTE